MKIQRLRIMSKVACVLGLLAFPSLSLVAAEAVQAPMWRDTRKGVEVKLGETTLSLEALSPNAIRVQCYQEKPYALPEWLYVPQGKTPPYQVTEEKGRILLTLPEMSVAIDKEIGTLRYFDKAGNAVLSELNRSLTPSAVQGEKVYAVRQTFDSPKEECLYGMGQFQDGYLNIRGLTRRLTQVNTQISIPFLLSSRGYGLLWNNYGLTDFNPADQKVVFTAGDGAKESTSVKVTTTEGTKQEKRVSGAFSATLEVPVSGEYALLLDVGSPMARRHHLTLDGKTLTDVKNIWLPPTTSMIVHLEKGRHRLTAQLEARDKPVLFYRLIQDETVFHSPVAPCLDYTVFVGEPENIIAAYRQATGPAPMMPRWAMGYIHCRERFHTQQELLNAAKTFRAKRIPMDVIVQDWMYWGRHGWNAMCFDKERYPDPAEMVKQVHQMNARLMISVWSKIDAGSEVGKQLAAKGFYIPNTTWVDFFNPEAAACYWQNFSSRLLKPYRIDAWWQDATEPENDDLVGRRVAGGTIPGEKVRNLYPLMVNKTVYEGCRKDDPERRTMILTRSGFAGMQRYAAATWSGDVSHDWETLRRQIAGGLGQMASGLPWWTYDAGGFFRTGASQYTDPAYHERFLRWLQAGAFLPLLRVHGYGSNTEFWNYGEEVTRIARETLNLRYRLLPYVYSENARVAFAGSTLTRPLVMDFRKDKEALAQTSQFMFGPSLLIAPILRPGVTAWDVYLPKTDAGWYDFWTGEKMRGGQHITHPVTLEHLPIFVKAGAILPLAEAAQYAEERWNDRWEIRVYPGADGAYTLYDDEGDNYRYEEGHCARIRLRWDDRSQTLHIAPREGSFPGMPRERTFRVVKVQPGIGAGSQPEGKAYKEIVYKGEAVDVTF